MLCKFDRAIFRSDNGFCIYSYSTKDESVPQEARNHHAKSAKDIFFTAVGNRLPACEGVTTDLTGSWEKSKYGYQLKVEHCEQILPSDRDGIIGYLSSGFIKGIGPKTAKAIVARFGDRTLDILDRDPQQLLSVKGIAKSKLDRIIKSYQQTKDMRLLTEYLMPYEVSEKKIIRIWEEYGNESLNVLKTDPFQLCTIRGFGFLTVDAIARKTKVSLKNPLRFSGAFQYILDEAGNEGHLFLPQSTVVEKAYELLNRGMESEIVSTREIDSFLNAEIRSGRVYNDNGRIYLPFVRKCEVQVAKKIVAMLLHGHYPHIQGLSKEIGVSEKTLKRSLAPLQKQAVSMALLNPCSIMTGGPGTGKTTTLSVILDVYHRLFPDKEILLAAPTGKASRRMNEQTGFPAATLHSALGILSDDEFEYEQADLLPYDFIVLDECSMMDMRISYALFRRLKPSAKVLLVGDPDQLPSVGAGNVLREMIRSGIVPTAVLSDVFRQAGNSRIALNAAAVNRNDTHLLTGPDFQILDVTESEEALPLVMKCYLEEAEAAGTENVQVLSPFRRKGTVCADRINAELRDIVNPKGASEEVKVGTRVFRAGDRVIQTKNRDGVSNGDIGIISSIAENDDEEKEVIISMIDGRQVTYSQDMLENLDLAYCISIHKSQGTESPTVIIPMLKEHYVMLRRNLLYTAISRAKKKVILIGQRQAIYMAIHKNDVDKRNTVLADRIALYYKREKEKSA